MTITTPQTIADLGDAAPKWLRDAKTENAIVALRESDRESDKEWVIWHQGDFLGGDFLGGDFLGGYFLGGSFLGGSFLGERIISSGSLGSAKSSGRHITWLKTTSHEILIAECFHGTAQELRAKVLKVHFGENRAWYLKSIKAIRSTF